MKAQYKSYHHIDHQHTKGAIEYWKRNCPHAFDMFWHVYEKIDGQCVVIGFDAELAKNRSFILGSRTRQIEEDKDFSGVRTILKEDVYQPFLNYFWQQALLYPNMCYIAYCEVFGDGVLKTPMKYGHKRIRCFDICIDDVYVDANIFDQLAHDFEQMCGQRITVPLLGVCQSFEDALAFDLNRSSQESDSADKYLIEGIVVKPERTIVDKVGKRLCFKVKNEWASEVSKPKQLTEEQKQHRDLENKQIDEWKSCFLKYLNERRVAGIMSKYGTINNESQIGDYIRYVINDMWQEFIVDYHDSRVEIGTLQKGIRNIGKEIMPLLKSYLQ